MVALGRVVDARAVASEEEFSEMFTQLTYLTQIRRGEDLVPTLHKNV